MDNRSTQLLKGTLDMCLLALLSREPSYGYAIVEQLARGGLDLVSEGSIYPLLSRLQHRGYVEAYVVPSAEGPSRKYYRVVPSGLAQLARWRDEWGRFAGAVDQILRGDGTYDGDSASQTADRGSGERV